MIPEQDGPKPPYRRAVQDSESRLQNHFQEILKMLVHRTRFA
jgi:hypothetical protein